LRGIGEKSKAGTLTRNGHAVNYFRGGCVTGSRKRNVYKASSRDGLWVSIKNIRKH